MKTFVRWLGACALASTMSPAWAQDFVPGRPGNTDSPISVPAGHWQVETELAGYAHGRGAKSWSALATDFRHGLASGWDVEAIVSPYLREEAGGETIDGVGDTTFRLRRTFAGQDGEGPAFAMIGFVTAPTAQNGLGDGAWEGGAEITGSFSLGPKTGLTYTAGVGAVSDAGDYRSDIFAGVNIAHAFTDELGAFAEVFAYRSLGATATTLDIGATYLSGPRTQWDIGCDLGLTDAADDARFYLGWAHLF